MSLSIVSPYTHLNGHYWPYTLDLVRALQSESIEFEVYASREPRYEATTAVPLPAWNACSNLTRYMLSENYRASHWGARSENLVRNIEFHACIRAALANQKSNHHIHCVESAHRILHRQVIASKTKTFSTLCVGDPPTGLSIKRMDQYKRAFDTGRLTFIVETESVRDAWKEIAGEHVVHIPAALPWTPHLPIPQLEARRQLNLPLDEVICLFFGTHREGKDYETAIRAAQLCKSKPYLLFVGPLISGNDPEALARSLGYEHFESRSGYLPDSFVPLVFDAADVVMLPYADNYTKGSAVLLQACHFKKPVIATDTGHLREFVHLNQNGLLYTSQKIEELSKRYDEIAGYKILGEGDNRWSFNSTLSRYSWTTLIHIYKKIFKCN